MFIGFLLGYFHFIERKKCFQFLLRRLRVRTIHSNYRQVVLSSTLDFLLVFTLDRIPELGSSFKEIFLVALFKRNPKLMIWKKVEVSLRLFDIFERNRVFIFLCGSWGSPRGKLALQ